MPHPHQFVAHLLHLSSETLRYGFALYREPSILSTLRTDMRKTKKVKGFRLPLVSLSPILYGKSAKLYQASLLRVHFQPKLLHANLKLLLEAFRILLVLESHDKVIRVSDNDDFSLGMAFSPPLHPQVQDIVQVDICQ